MKEMEFSSGDCNVHWCKQCLVIYNREYLERRASCTGRLCLYLCHCPLLLQLPRTTSIGLFWCVPCSSTRNPCLFAGLEYSSIGGSHYLVNVILVTCCFGADTASMLIWNDFRTAGWDWCSTMGRLEGRRSVSESGNNRVSSLNTIMLSVSPAAPFECDALVYRMDGLQPRKSHPL